MFKNGRIGIVIAVCALLAVLLGAGIYIKAVYTIKTVYVEGNVHYSEDDIKEIVMDGLLGNNSLYLSMKYKNRGIEGIPFVDVLDVKILSPDTIKIIVYEKTLIGYVKQFGSYIYFDKDGYVEECSSVRTVGIPQITGLQFDYAVIGKALPVENEVIFDNILNITKLLTKYSLTADKIYFNSSEEITVYFGNIKVALGNDSNSLEDKLMQLPEILGKLEGKNGILHMEKFDKNNGDYTFIPE